MNYIPPFTITARTIDLISQISEAVGEINSLESSPRQVELRKKNRIKTIQSSLAIENNSLSVEQITAIIEGKRVLGSPNEILEVKNALNAYELLLTLNPFSEKDLLKAHKFMMANLVSQSGKYRSGGVGVFDGSGIVHLAPPAERVPFLMSDLFAWLKKSDVHPLVKSCVFHYEFEFIHPFEDGNGRIGRLWQSVILKHWKDVFAWLPVETLIKENQEAYYMALSTSDSDAESTKFIVFMLELILKTINEILVNEKKITQKIDVKITANQKKILETVMKNPFLTQEELAKIVGIAKLNINKNMKILQEKGLLERIGADKNGSWLVKKEVL